MMKRESSCPYAIALSSDDDSSVGSESIGESSFSSLQELCPAFKKNSSDGTTNCPFKEAKSADDMKQVMLQIPPSHLQESGHFSKVMQRLHQFVPSGNKKSTINDFSEKESHGTGHGESSSLPGGCPMKEYYSGSTAAAVDARTTTVPYTLAMEDSSLSAVMERMAREMATQTVDQQEHKEQERNGEVKKQEEKQLRQIKDKQKQVRQQKRPKIQLAQALKDGTAAAHQKAEDVDFINDFVHGKIDRNVYPRFVLSLYYIYNAMEECLDVHANQHFASCHFPKELQRKQSLLEDLEFWFPISSTSDASSLSTLPKPSPATQDYINRLQEIAQSNPLLLLSHAYTRYLGDLSGGKILQRVARKALGLTKDTITNLTEGLAFYEFADIPFPKKFKDEYRDSLDELDLTDEQIRLLVKEANISFLLNIRIFQEFSSKKEKPVPVMSLQEALMVQQDNLETENHVRKRSNSDTSKCPFLFSSENKKNSLVVVENHTKRENNKKNSGGVCPWPFILLHDFRTGMKDLKSWVLIGLLLSFLWSQFIKYYSA